MSSTNLTDGRSELCFSIVIYERNNLRPGERPGDATRTSKNDAEKLLISLGVSDMQLSARKVAINKAGHRGNNSQRQDMEKMDYKVERMKKINAAKLKEKEEAEKKESSAEHDEQEI